jgi:transposase-like protein
MKWTEMNAEERYRVVELARKGEQSMAEVCETFGVSRQTLHKAMTAAQEAAIAALAPKMPGRKGPSEEAQKITELSKTQSSLEKEIHHWKTRYEVAQAYIDIVHEQEAREARAEKTERNRRKRERAKQKKKPRVTSAKKSGAATANDEANAEAAVADSMGGADNGDGTGEPAQMGETPDASL